jgi:hypothetical protein
METALPARSAVNPIAAIIVSTQSSALAATPREAWSAPGDRDRAPVQLLILRKGTTRSKAS